MNIFGEIMFVYGMTFLISMFVALIIKILAGMIDFLPEDKSLSFSTVLVAVGHNFRSKWAGNKKVIQEFKNTNAGVNNELFNFYHERD